MKQLRLPHGFLCLAITFSAANCASAQSPQLINQVGPAPAPASQPAGPMTLEQALDALENREKSLDSFVTDVTMKETDEDTQLEDTQIGKVWYERLKNGNVRIRVSFVSRQNGKVTRPEAKEYVLDNGWLTERDYDKKIEIRRQVAKPGEKMNLFKLNGLFPLPIGQKKEDVKKVFETSRVKVTSDDKVPPDTTHIVLKPRETSDIRNQFSVIDVFIDPLTNMPLKVDTLDKEKNKSRSTSLKEMKVNPPLTDKEFTLPAIKDAQGWNIHEEPLKDQ